jgi:hypothetical protein
MSSMKKMSGINLFLYFLGLESYCWFVYKAKSINGIECD